MIHLFLTLYSALYSLGAVAYLPVLLYRRIIRKKKSVTYPRLAAPSELGTPGRGISRIWIHAVSVGEVNAVKALVLELHARKHQVVISTTTQTGQAQAKNLFRDKAEIIYFPLDFGFVCRRFLRRVAPSLVLLAETEIWPNFVHSASRLEIPLILINGRISDSSFRNYRRLHFFFKLLLERMSHFCMQSKLDKERILDLGAPPNSTNWVGNLKFDYQLQSSLALEDLKKRVQQLLSDGPESPIWLCGSTKPGEEVLLLSAFERLRKRFPHLKMILAPRHPHRAQEVYDLVKTQGYAPLLRSKLNNSAQERTDVLVLDTIGELAHLYEIATLVFIGGSLVPMGGQNLIEAAAFGKPILFGPHMQNFREIAQAFVQDYAALQVADAEELAARIEDLLEDRHAREWLGRNARKVIRNNQGAVERTLEIIEGYLSDV